jgi:phosphotriesterase-related protein
MVSRREFLTRATAAGVAAAALAPEPAAAQANSTSQPGSGVRASGVVQTVRGPVDASTLGFVLPHEHLCPSSAGMWQVWPELFGGRADFVDRAVAKLKAVRNDGVDTIVDVTTADIGRDVRLIEEVSRKSGMRIIAATGHWLNPSLSMEARTAEELTDFFLLEINRGLEGTDIRPGVIKVASDRDGITPFLEKALRAAARASKASGVPVTTHTYAVGRGGEKQAEIFESEGLNPSKVCLGHSDESDDPGYLTGLAKRGYTIGMDHFTSGTAEIQQANPKALSWQRRVENVKRLIDAGFADRVLLSNDWYFGISMAVTNAMAIMDRMNPDGMRFVTRNTIPHLKQLGVTTAQIRTMTIENPRRFFGSS